MNYNTDKNKVIKLTGLSMLYNSLIEEKMDHETAFLTTFDITLNDIIDEIEELLLPEDIERFKQTCLKRDPIIITPRIGYILKYKKNSNKI